MFMSARLWARGVAKSSGNAEIAREVERVAAENFITVLLLPSTLSRDSLIKFVSGIAAEATKNESAAMRHSDRILMARAACFADNMTNSLRLCGFSQSDFLTFPVEGARFL